jgi:hypothetical protein
MKSREKDPRRIHPEVHQPESQPALPRAERQRPSRSQNPDWSGNGHGLSHGGAIVWRGEDRGLRHDMRSETKASAFWNALWRRHATLGSINQFCLEDATTGCNQPPVDYCISIRIRMHGGQGRTRWREQCRSDSVARWRERFATTSALLFIIGLVLVIGAVAFAAMSLLLVFLVRRSRRTLRKNSAWIRPHRSKGGPKSRRVRPLRGARSVMDSLSEIIVNAHSSQPLPLAIRCPTPVPWPVSPC